MVYCFRVKVWLVGGGEYEGQPGPGLRGHHFKGLKDLFDCPLRWFNFAG